MSESMFSAATRGPLDVEASGAGPRVVLVHGSILNGQLAWAEQRPLSQRWRLEILNRRGYGASPPPTGRSDFEEDARDIVAHLGDGAHLVGFSYGAIAALFAAALRPHAVRSLTLLEPPAFGAVKELPAAKTIIAARAGLKRDAPPREFYESFRRLVHGPDAPPLAPLPDPLPPAVEQGVRTGMMQREPFEAVLPLEALKAAALPTLIISGGHNPAYEAVCDLLHRELPSERSFIPGAGHNITRMGAVLNERLETFLKMVELRA